MRIYVCRQNIYIDADNCVVTLKSFVVFQASVFNVPYRKEFLFRRNSIFKSNNDLFFSVLDN